MAEVIEEKFYYVRMSSSETAMLKEILERYDIKDAKLESFADMLLKKLPQTQH